MHSQTDTSTHSDGNGNLFVLAPFTFGLNAPDKLMLSSWPVSVALSRLLMDSQDIRPSVTEAH